MWRMPGRVLAPTAPSSHYYLRIFQAAETAGPFIYRIELADWSIIAILAIAKLSHRNNCAAFVLLIFFVFMLALCAFDIKPSGRNRVH